MIRIQSTGVGTYCLVSIDSSVVIMQVGYSFGFASCAVYGVVVDSSFALQVLLLTPRFAILRSLTSSCAAMLESR